MLNFSWYYVKIEQNFIFLLKPYYKMSLICMYFPDCSFTMGLGDYSLGRNISCTLGILCLPEFLCLGFWAFPFHSMSTGAILAQTVFKQSCWFPECCFSGLSRSYHPAGNLTSSSSYSVSLPPFCSAPWVSGAGVVVDVSVWAGLHNPAW